jgi:hypothetical protein
VLATCTGEAGHGGLARMLVGFCLGDGVLWVGSGEVAMVGDVQRAEGEERGVLGTFSFFSSTFHGLGRGRGGWARPRRLSRHCYRVRARENSGAHSETNFLRFLLTTCSIKCPQEFKFQIFQKWPPCFVNILDKGSRTIFVWRKYHVLQKLHLNFRVLSLFQIQTLADV